MDQSVLSWGRAHRYAHHLSRLSMWGGSDRAIADACQDGRSVIAHGMGRSYGDVALNENGALILTPPADNIVAADWSTGVVRAASGLTLEALLRICVPKGWFPKVVPGTKYVTLGGAVANDVHGKNHFHAGSFGAGVRSLQLTRSTGESLVCSPTQNEALFEATIGGLGLTGLIDWVEFELDPIASSSLDVENLRCHDLYHFYDLFDQSKDWPYTVMWIDCFAPKPARGRGVFTRAKSSTSGLLEPHDPSAKLRFPIETPGIFLNKMTIAGFNALYRRRPASTYCGLQHYDPFFFPLDGILEWNRMYGRKGFYQHQSLLPLSARRDGVLELLDAIEKAGQGSFLAVLKVHGKKRSPGVLSFCDEGVSLALDFSNKGRKTTDLLARLDDIVLRHGGRNYIAKDGHMSSAFFKQTYPKWEQVERLRDPKFSSSLWRRLTGI